MMKKIKYLLIAFFVFISVNLSAASYLLVTDINNVRTYDVFIDQAVVKPSAYRDLLMCLQYAQKQDTFIFHINTDGGDAYSAIEIYNAIKSTKANTIADLYKGYSAGALIAVACKKIIVNDFATMMIHSFYLGISGNVQEVNVELEFMKGLNDFIIRAAFAEFLDKEEMNQILSGKNLWLNEDQIFIKIGKINKLFKK